MLRKLTRRPPPKYTPNIRQPKNRHPLPLPPAPPPVNTPQEKGTVPFSKGLTL